ncbi:hypothetical protein RAS12_16200 [Achromobacter seleniivolatilans]|uniref:Uncharacterized protein n=1 Tax=Achromobacter seleniivolatilans TaxID=3047478 RepID=A0ABY9LTU8_9BURK|nr:hypothetical protein [Achromobacter sp. R39]WMD18194.1 hypothetical protein RAS12_16200 [Achromobacter sp. R39]
MLDKGGRWKEPADYINHENYSQYHDTDKKTRVSAIETRVCGIRFDQKKAGIAAGLFTLR